MTQIKKGILDFRLRFLFLFGASVGFLSTGCSVFYSRPTQEMSDMSAAIRAAREANAFELSPELFRQANEWSTRARNEYKLKNFKLAKDYASKARVFAESAEFESIRVIRHSSGGDSHHSAPPPPTPTEMEMNEAPPPPPPSDEAPPPPS